MKCFECGTKCVTLYWYEDRILTSYDFKAGTPITHVNNACPNSNCEWTSYKTKLPEKIA